MRGRPSGSLAHLHAESVVGKLDFDASGRCFCLGKRELMVAFGREMSEDELFYPDPRGYRARLRSAQMPTPRLVGILRGRFADEHVGVAGKRLEIGGRAGVRRVSQHRAVVLDANTERVRRMSHPAERKL